MKAKHLFWIVPLCLIVGAIYGYSIDAGGCTVNEKKCSDELLKCRANFLFYEQLVKECDSCVAKANK